MPRKLETYHHVYFLGIGGIGMSAVARYLLHEGLKVSGYDRDETELTCQLSREGMNIHYEDDVQQIPHDVDLVIYTPAIPDEHQELSHVRQTDLPVYKRSEALKVILAHKKVIAVAGTHGKTSTSALLAHILHSQDFSVTAFIGGIMNNYSSNFIHGTGDWVIVEADEYDRSFLRLYPTLAVIHAVDPDHLDIYGTHDEIQSSFQDFTLQIKEEGTLWVRDQVSEFWNNQEWQDQLIAHNVTIHSFGDRQADAVLKELSQGQGISRFSLQIAGQSIDTQLVMPGRHNMINALAAAAVAHKLGLSQAQIANGISTFSGIERRYQFIHLSDDLVIIDDYAHHPVEIEAAITTTRQQFPNKQLTVVFQPHLYTRTRDFAPDFAKALDKADRPILVELYPAREKPIEKISSLSIVKIMANSSVIYIKKCNLLKILESDRPEVLLFLGAGDMNKMIPEIKARLVTC